MKKIIITAISLVIFCSNNAYSADNITLQLKWVTQGQFAGYYVALQNGYYAEENLNVTIRPGGPDVSPVQLMMGGGADVMVDWMPSALAAREQGAPFVNIAQIYKHSGMMLTCRKDSGITSTKDLPGKTLGVWFFGNEYPFLSWMSHLGIPTDGSADGVTILKQGFNVDPLLQKQVACISTTTYNEYLQLIDAGMTDDELLNFKYEDQGADTLEDGLYVLEDRLKDPKFVDEMVRFVRATMKGWRFAELHPREAAEIVLEYDETGAQEEHHQIQMVQEVTKLTKDSNGVLDPKDYERTVKILLDSPSTPVINKEPKGAWTHIITDKIYK